MGSVNVKESVVCILAEDVKKFIMNLQNGQKGK